MVRACGSIARIRNCVDINTLREVYHALIHSYLRYGLAVWGTASHTTLKPLIAAMDRAIRIICSAPLGRNVDVDPFFEILDILKFDDLYTLEVCKFMFKLKNDLLPVRMVSHFEFRPVPERRYNLRVRPNNPGPEIIHRTACGKKSIHTRGDEKWRLIPQSVKECDSPNSFKTKLKVWLLSNNIS